MNDKAPQDSGTLGAQARARLAWLYHELEQDLSKNFLLVALGALFVAISAFLK